MSTLPLSSPSRRLGVGVNPARAAQVVSLANAGHIPRALQLAGFAPVELSEARRVVISTAAGEKTGKTHFGCTFPKPIAFISHDTGTKEIVEKFIREGKLREQDVALAEFEIPDVSSKPKIEEYEKIWERAKEAYKAMTLDTYFQTLIVDTATESWELCRLARFGKLSQVLPHQYGPVNTEFRDMIKLADRRKDLNVLLIHKLKKEYRENKSGKDVWTGRWERAGFGDMPYLVGINGENYCETTRDPETRKVTATFGFRLIDCRYNADCIGLELDGKECKFPYLASNLWPETSPVDWGVPIEEL